MSKVILHDDTGFKMWESWYGLICCGININGCYTYRWSFIFMGRDFTISLCPEARRFAIQVDDLYHWEPMKGPPKTIFWYHN